MIESGTHTHNLLDRVCRATDDDRLSTPPNGHSRMRDRRQWITSFSIAFLPSPRSECVRRIQPIAHRFHVIFDMCQNQNDVERRRLCTVSVWRANISIVVIAFVCAIWLTAFMDASDTRCRLDRDATWRLAARVQATLFKINWFIIGGANSQIIYVLNTARITVMCSCPVSRKWLCHRFDWKTK